MGPDSEGVWPCLALSLTRSREAKLFQLSGLHEMKPRFQLGAFALKQGGGGVLKKKPRLFLPLSVEGTGLNQHASLHHPFCRGGRVCASNFCESRACPFLGNQTSPKIGPRGLCGWIADSVEMTTFPAFLIPPTPAPLFPGTTSRRDEAEPPAKPKATYGTSLLLQKTHSWRKAAPAQASLPSACPSPLLTPLQRIAWVPQG